MAVLGLELVVILGVAVLACQVIAPRLHTAEPLLLIVVGILVGFVPALRAVHLPASVMLLIFLPALLFRESLSTSLREIRSNLRAILLLSTLLVAITAAVVAVSAHALGVPWGPAWVIGAALAPTDATATTVLTRLLPRRSLNVLRAESLVNDGTALVIYGVAVGVTAGEQTLDGWNITGQLALSYAGGLAAGFVVVAIITFAQRRLRDTIAVNVATLISPFGAFLLAEVIGASGVIAVVTCGLVMSRTGPHLDRPDSRQQSVAFWTLATFLLNGSLFVLIGIESQSAIRALTSVDLTRGVVLVFVITAVIIGTRFTWMFTTVYVIRLLDRRPAQRHRRIPARVRVVSGVAGFRGAVSLAAALAVPLTVESGAPFPDRDLIVFVAAGVIVLTMLQTYAMPSVVRWARLPADDTDGERRQAETRAVEETLQALDHMATELGVDDTARERVRRVYEVRLRILQDDAALNTSSNGTRNALDHGENVSPLAQEAAQFDALSREALRHKRGAIVRMRDDGEIDDSVLQEVQTRLDLEELRLS